MYVACVHTLAISFNYYSIVCQINKCYLLALLLRNECGCHVEVLALLWLQCYQLILYFYT